MIFVCTDETCENAVEGDEIVEFCPHCGSDMKEANEEDLSGASWSDLGVFWRCKQSEEADRRAVECFRNATKKGDSCGISNLGLCFLHGFGVEKDEKRAFWLFRQAAANDYVPAYNHLGDCYSNGTGTPKDYEQAFEWHMKAADCGYAKAQLRVGRAYELGQIPGITRG